MKRYARSWFEQFRGLMFDDTPGAELEFVFKKPTRLGASIHTCFMRYPIHVQWLDENRELIEEKTFYPWTLNYTPKEAAKFIIETRVGEVMKHG